MALRRKRQIINPLIRFVAKAQGPYANRIAGGVFARGMGPQSLREELWSDPAAIINAPWVYEGNGVYFIDDSQTGTTAFGFNFLLPDSTSEYLVKFTISDYVSSGATNAIYAQLGFSNGTLRTANGSYSELIKASSNTNVRFYGQSDVAARISNISISI